MKLQVFESRWLLGRGKLVELALGLHRAFAACHVCLVRVTRGGEE